MAECNLAGIDDGFWLGLTVGIVVIGLFNMTEDFVDGVRVASVKGCEIVSTVVNVVRVDLGSLDRNLLRI